MSIQENNVNLIEPIKCLDHGFIRLIEAWGHGDAGNHETVNGYLHDSDIKGIDYECGLVEAARQSTQGSFRGWQVDCEKCKGLGSIVNDREGGKQDCLTCNGVGKIEQDTKLLRTLYNFNHATPFEFAGMVIEVQAPIFVFREWHRHRTQSFNEMSARYAPLPDLNYIPTINRCLRNSTKNKQAGVIKGAEQLEEKDAQEFQSELSVMYSEQQKFYDKWLNKGMPKELARIDLPVGRYSKMRASTCLRNWLGFITLRSDPNAQEEIRVYSQALESIVSQLFPRTWQLFLTRRNERT